MSTGEVGNGGGAGGGGDAGGGAATESAATGGAFAGSEGVAAGDAGNGAGAGFGQPTAPASPEYDPATPDWAKDYSAENRDAIVKNGFKSLNTVIHFLCSLPKILDSILVFIRETAAGVRLAAIMEYDP